MLALEHLRAKLLAPSPALDSGLTSLNHCLSGPEPDLFLLAQVNEAFFSSPRLAHLSTQAEVLAQQALQRRQEQDAEAVARASPAQLLSSWECPICLEAVHQPVVLT